jgi:GTP-binding protein YchF
MDSLRAVDGFLHVVRGFASDRVFHVLTTVDALRDLEVVMTELLFADLELVEKRLERIAKDRFRPGSAERVQEEEVLTRCRQHLEQNRPLRTLELKTSEQTALASLRFLTQKPQILVVNVGEDEVAEGAQGDLPARIRDRGGNGDVVVLSAAIEQELADLPADEQASFMSGLGIAEPAAHRLTRAAFHTLGMMSFFTVGPDEVRAWSVRQGALAPEAAGKIHTDLERGFIRAETIHYDDLAAAGSEKAARQSNLFRLNGKEYAVRDGDVLNIRFSV